MNVAHALASAITARNNCLSGSMPRLDIASVWFEVIDRITREVLPTGSGFDSGTTVGVDLSTANCLVLHTSFHHMNEHGMYDGWTEHTLRVRPTFDGSVRITISGKNRNEIKDYIHDVFHAALTASVPDTCTFAACKRGI